MNQSQIKNPQQQAIPARQSGFALVVTLSLMILLTVIAVGLLTLSSISLRASSQSQDMSVARANARMALILAIGDLQREMGPDGRISAPADAGKEAKGGDPHWTAVYDAWTKSPASSDFRETPGSRSPNFRGWLVSGGNQATGGSTSPPARVTLLDAGSLGPGAGPDSRIRVPLLAIKNGARNGRIAWWTADEGTKAKVNAGPDSNPTSDFAKADPFFNAQSPPNNGHRAIPQLAGFDWIDGKRALTVTTGQLNLAAGTGPAGLGDSLHDTTVHSAGVLADVRTGRLKRDLSNLLTRPATELTNKPLYLADGRMNWFDITDDGKVTNTTGVGSTWAQNYNSSSQWGINLEELHLFHSLHRELDWTGSKPGLVMKSTREAVVQDRHYLYLKPSIQGLQFIFSLSAVPDTGGKFKMQMNLDAMVAISNPNDVAIKYPAGLVFPFQLLNMPYSLAWNIQRTSGTITTTTTPNNFQVFLGHVEGGTSGIPAAGFTLEPGEAAVFGSSSASGFNLNLKRGFAPSGGVKLTTWDLKASGLDATDRIDFDFKRLTKPADGSSWTYYNTWIGRRDLAKGVGWQMDSASLTGTSFTSSSMDQFIPASVRPQQVRPVSDFINKPQPVLMISFLQNVEQSSGASPPDGFASRTSQLNEVSLIERRVNADRMLVDRHGTQMMITAEAMNYQFRTLAAGAGGRSIYIGGGRQPNLGGSFNMISRRIPLSPPLSIGSFQNAIASGFCDHFNERAQRAQIGANPLAVGGDPFPSNASALTGLVHALPIVSRAIGNSQAIPHLRPDEVFSSAGGASLARGSGAGAVAKVATDHSWMINTALWDAWFLSGIVDGTGSGGSPWMTDTRTARSQFSDFANGRKTLRNKRYTFHPFKTAENAMQELFTGNNFKPSAINLLPRYLLVDGAFNVNSTSVKAWNALLSGVRKQSLITGNGSTQSFENSYGTLGFAANTATSGTAGDWAGLRDLTDADIESLAVEIVAEVKSRGPFLSLADFVNRRPASTEKSHQVLGALQSAIDRSGLNNRLTVGNRGLTPTDFANLPGRDITDDEPAPARAVGSSGHLSQGSLLTAIGSQITVRSDTFIIRAYGDARDSSDKILARAWCEAVIQRVPDYLDPANPPEAQKGWPTATTTLAPANEKFGRRFLMKSFRWLSSAEI